MTTTNKGIPAVSLPNATAVLYTAINCRATITKATVTNQGTLNNTFNFYIVPGTSAAPSNRLVNAEVLGDKEGLTVTKLIGQTLNPGWTLQGDCGAATAITFALSVAEQT